MIIFIPIKHNSQRVPNKNFRSFGGVELYKHTLYKFNQYRIFVDTDSENVLNEIKKDEKLAHVIPLKRKKHLVGHKVSVCSLIRDFVQDYEVEDVIAQIHVTSPFLRPETLSAAAQKIHEYDSVVSCNVLQTRIWRKEKYGYCPVNHNPLKLEQTQDLPKFYEENSTFYIFKPETIINGSRIGKNPYFYEITHPENLDIDTEEDFKVCINTFSKQK